MTMRKSISIIRFWLKVSNGVAKTGVMKRADAGI